MSTLYVRANGEIPCYDDAGAQIALSHVAADQPFVADHELDNHNYRHIRASFQEGRVPWHNTCDRCAMLRRDEPLKDTLKERRITTLQIEPTLACGLLCPACTRLDDLKTRKKPFRLMPPDFGRLLEGLRRDGYSIGVIEYCGNGEPLNHPNFTDFVRVGRRYFPHVRQRLITNGNFEYDDKLRSVHIDEFIVSCDGAKQSSYEQYRVKGDIEKVFRFMEAIPSEIAGYRQKRIWKYILFDFNDSNEEILEAQSLMKKMGVDELMFIKTHSISRSTRFDSGDALPIAAENVLFDQTQMNYRGSLALIPREPLTPRAFNDGRSFIQVDSVRLDSQETATIKGWVIGCEEGALLSFTCNGVGLEGTLQRSMYRPDVENVYPQYSNARAGFEFSWLFNTTCLTLSICIEIDRPAATINYVFDQPVPS